MSTSIVPFSFESSQIRTITDDHGEPWFVLADVCTAIGIENPSRVKERLDPEDTQVFDLSALSTAQGCRNNNLATLVNESGMYACVLQSRKPEAKKFKRWVTSEVLPSIRKTGGYFAGMTPSEMLVIAAQQLVELERKQAAQQRLIDEHTQKLKQLDGDTGYMTASAFCRKQGVKAPLRFSRKLGKLCTKMSKELEIMIGKVADERYGTVNTYHVDVLAEVMEEIVEKEKHEKVTKLHEVEESEDKN